MVLQTSCRCLRQVIKNGQETALILIRDAKKRGVQVTCESAPHYMLLTDKELLRRDANWRMNPPLREQRDCEAIIEGFCDGTIDAMITDHAPHSPEEKADFGKLKLDECYVDIGAKDRETALKAVAVGDTMIYDSPCFTNQGKVVSPYLDNRISCAILLKVLEEMAH